MMTRRLHSEARHAGRMAVVAHRLQGGPSPENPFRTGDRRRYWHLGAQEAERIVGDLLEYAPCSAEPAGMAAQRTSAQGTTRNA